LPFEGKRVDTQISHQEVGIMITKTITEIEERIKGTPSINEKEREELLGLLSALGTEVSELSKTNPECAESITGFTRMSAHEATRTARNPKLVGLSLKGLSSSVEGFEGSHPQLVAVVNKISQILANMGI
jgi:hypothetical protein